MAAKKVEVDIIACIRASLIGRAVIKYAKTFKSDVTVFIGNILLDVTLIIFSFRVSMSILTMSLSDI